MDLSIGEMFSWGIILVRALFVAWFWSCWQSVGKYDSVDRNNKVIWSPGWIFGIKLRCGEQDPPKPVNLHLGHAIKKQQVQDESFKVRFPFPGADAPLFTEAGILIILLSLSLCLELFHFVLTNYKLIGPERCSGVKQFDFDELAISYKNYFIKKVDFFSLWLLYQMLWCLGQQKMSCTNQER